MITLFKNHFKEFDTEKFVEELRQIIDDNTIIVNIGTNQYIGDSLAPLVGTILKENNFKLPVFGTVDDPIHALNIEKKLEEIKIKFPNAKLIGIDAYLGDDDDIGKISIRNCPINPGKGVGKSLPSVGTYSIFGVVDTHNSMEPFFLRTVRLSLVLSMARKIAEGLIKTSKYIKINEEKIVDNDNVYLVKCN